MGNGISDIIGFRGEKIVELCLTKYRIPEQPLFRPGFLGDKWPVIDFYVELRDVAERQLYFFCQAKTTATVLTKRKRYLPVGATRKDFEQLLRIPGPTYLFGIHEPSRRVFIRAVCLRSSPRAFAQIPLEYELTRTTLEILHREVREFWAIHHHKPQTSAFL